MPRWRHVGWHDETVYCTRFSVVDVGAAAVGWAVDSDFFAAFLPGAFTAFFTGAGFLGAAFRTAIVSVTFFAVFAGADFVVVLDVAFAASARFSPPFLVAAIIAALPALLSLRFAFRVPGGAGGSAAFFDAAHRLLCASAIAFLPAALILRLGFFSPVRRAPSTGVAPIWRLMSAIF